MANFFNSVHITNFKSLKDVTLSDCKRINVLIGKPNVGKSNILEAIGLFSLPYFQYNNKRLSQFVRLENIAELFFDGDIDEKIDVRSDLNNFCTAEYSKEEGLVHLELEMNKEKPASNKSEKLSSTETAISRYSFNVDRKLNLSLRKKRFDPYPYSKVKYYQFPCKFEFGEEIFRLGRVSLTPLRGSNLLAVIEDSELLKNDFSKLFAEYGLRLLFDKTNQTLRIDKPLKENAASFPFSSIADTLQRIIFFKAAITSNKDSIILFEEPEAHCFPPYIAHFTQEVIHSESNQFFIATHSPYVLNDFLEDTKIDLAIYMVDFQNGQTVVYRLSNEEVDEVYNYGIDVFFNYERFTKHG